MNIGARNKGRYFFFPLPSPPPLLFFFSVFSKRLAATDRDAARGSFRNAREPVRLTAPVTRMLAGKRLIYLTLPVNCGGNR